VALAWLLLSLLAVPLVGRVHQVVHGGVLDQAHASGWVQQGASPAALGSHAVSATVARGATNHSAHEVHGAWLGRLLAGHAPADCLVLDQLALGDALQGATLALPGAVPLRARPAGGVQRTIAAQPAPFQARGPPRT
jgi:hypothetical protein